MADRGLGTVHRRLAVHEGRRSERRLAGQTSIQRSVETAAQRMAVAGRQLHEEIVRMLAIDQAVYAIPRLASGQ
ncbi:hypothetical protein [Caulobacter sp. DWR3-1-2]|uniref:hypothetical protein n=1 Tax=Caulobacter sp. DWR3-1-2 TaxID=2804647 RepID=UPI003CE84391